MTVYVDSMFLRADVGRVRGVWCHMFSDSLDPAELHELAHRIGTRRAWFQAKPDHPEHDHYDVTKTRRAAAVRAGAVEVSRERMVEIIQVKRTLLRHQEQWREAIDVLDAMDPHGTMAPPICKPESAPGPVVAMGAVAIEALP